MCDCISISKRLARVIEPFTDDSVPSSIEEVEETIQQHHLIRRKTLEVLHIDDLEQEGTRIDKHMHHTASNHLASNPDFSNTLATISDLLNQITNVKDRVETLWSKKNEKLQTSLKQRKFVKEAGNVCMYVYASGGARTQCAWGRTRWVGTIPGRPVSSQNSRARASIMISSGARASIMIPSGAHASIAISSGARASIMIPSGARASIMIPSGTWCTRFYSDL